jgi:diguanylate cyclase (GGDEF)-like protein/PAS domain S-box-containing protein
VADDDLMTLMLDAAVELAANGTVVAANEPALALFRCPLEEMVGSPVICWLDLGDLMRDGGRARVEGWRANGVPVLLDVSVRFVETGGARRVLCALREINHAALADEAQRYFDAAFDNAPIGMALFNTDGEYVRVNYALCELLGRTVSDLLGRRDQELTHPDDRQADVEVAWEILAGRYDTHQCEKRFVRPDGSIVWALANLTFLRDEDGRPLSWVGQFQDITARRAAEEALRASEERFRLAFDHAPIGLALVAPDGSWLRVNDRLCEMTGYSAQELLAGGTFQDITHPDDLDADLDHVRAMLAGEIQTYEMEKRYIRPDGSYVFALLSVSLVRNADGAPLYFISQIQDIGERKRTHAELQHLAHHDPLTGLPNRRAWDGALLRAISQARRDGTSLAVALLDLNAFKQINDSHGHEAGDQVLIGSARAWRAELRDSDLLARIGGDEFALLLADLRAGALDAIVKRLKQAVPSDAGCAIGIAELRDGDDADELMRRADAALYGDKGARRIGASPSE